MVIISNGFLISFTSPQEQMNWREESCFQPLLLAHTRQRVCGGG